MDLPVSETSFKVRPETYDQVINKISRLVEQFKDRLALDNLRLSERYIKGEVNVLIKARFAGQDYVAIFDRSPEVIELESRLVPSRHDYQCPAHADERDKQLVMFVRDVECVQPVEFVCPSTVRLGRVDIVLGSIRHSLYLSSLFGFVTLGGCKNRIASAHRGFAPGDQNELIGEMIQCAPQIVNSISGNQGEFDGRDANIIDLKNIIFHLRVMRTVNEIRLGIEEPITGNFKVTEMLFGPFNFLAD